MGFWRDLDKSIGQFIEFQPAVYKREIEQLTEPQLRERHKRIKRKLVGTTAALGLSAWAVPATAGLSLIGMGVAGRRFEINTKRCEIIEERLLEKGWHGHNMGLKDIAWGVAPVGLAHALVPGADHLVDHVTANMATHVAAHHGANHLIEQGANHVAHMAGDHSAGVHAVIASSNPGVVAASNELIYRATHTPVERAAEATGKWAVHQITEKGVGNATGYAVNKLADAFSAKQHIPSTSSRRVTEYIREPASHSIASSPSSNSKPTKIRTSTLVINKSHRGPESDHDMIYRSSTLNSSAQLPDPVVEAGGKLPAVMRLAFYLIPAAIYSTVGEEALWCICISGILWTSILKRSPLLAFLIPTLLLTLSNVNYLWVVSSSLAVLDIIGSRGRLLLVKTALYLLLCFSAGLIITSAMLLF